jgi:hypothetical protein
MKPNPVPDALLAEHPGLAQIVAALEGYRSAQPVAAPCGICGQPLRVTEAEATGGVWVTCEPGCTTFHAQHLPKR